MSFAPQQNWPAYHASVEPKQIEKDRLLSAAQKLQRYAEIFDSVWSLKIRSKNKSCDSSFESKKIDAREQQLLAYRNVPGPNRD